MPHRTCPKCKHGLSGIEGHHQIVLHAAPSGGDSVPRFKCAICGTLWKRSYVGDGLFLWNPEEPPTRPASSS